MGREHRAAALRSVLIFVALAAAWWAAGAWYRGQLLEAERTKLGRETGLQAAALANAINAKLYLLRGIETYALTGSSDAASSREIVNFARSLLADTPGVPYFAFAPDGANHFVVPLAGDAGRVGRASLDGNPLELPLTNRDLPENREVTVAGPYDLPQGGPCVVVRKALYRDDRFWGLLSLALDLQALLLEAGCDPVANGSAIALRSTEGTLLAGPAEVFRITPTVREVPLPQGRWELAAAPLDGWENVVRGRNVGFRFAGLAVAAMFSFLAYLITSRHIVLSTSVARHTRDLREANERLHREAAERQEALAALRESEERLRLAVENMPVMMAAFDEAGAVVAWNREGERLTGFPAAEMLGNPSVGDLLFPGTHQENCLLGEPDGERRDVRARECQLTGKDGAVRTLLWSDVSSRVAIPGWHRWGVGVDITERRQAEEELRKSEGKYRMLFEANPHPMWVYDMETLAILAVNDAATSHYGYSPEEFLALTIRDMRPPEDVPALMKRMGEVTDGLDQSGTWRHVKKDGSVFLAEIRSHGLEFHGRRSKLVLINDVTERHRLEEQLRQAQKMEAVGQLAGGVAHDFNNLLTVIIGCAELASYALEQGRDANSHLGEILAAADRATELTNQLLAFSRRQILQPRVLDVNEILAGLETLLHRLLGEDLGIEVIPAPGIGHVLADPGQLEQVIMNLAVNARDAMPKGGKLTVETGEVYLDRSYVKSHEGTQEGPHVMLSVSDTGGGMSPAVQARLFEPFFTTKARGKGTGLGLSTAYGIIKQSGGSISVYSEAGRGTTFKIYLPRVDGEAAEAPAPGLAEVPTTGDETLLVAEDDPAVRAITVTMLRQAGYTVLEATSPGEALRIAGGHPGPIHLLVTDVVMPEMGGKELADALARVRPETRVLFVSGYTENAIVHHGVLDRGIAFLPKPFTVQTLSRKVRAVLDGST